MHLNSGDFRFPFVMATAFSAAYIMYFQGVSIVVYGCKNYYPCPPQLLLKFVWDVLLKLID